MVAYLLDALIIGIMVGFAAYMYRFDRKLRSMRSALSAIDGVVGQFSEKVDQSETLLSQLRDASKEISEALTTDIDRALKLQEDMRFLLGRCDSAAERLQSKMAGRPAAAGPANTAVANAPERPDLAGTAQKKETAPVVRPAQTATPRPWMETVRNAVAKPAPAEPAEPTNGAAHELLATMRAISSETSS